MGALGLTAALFGTGGVPGVGSGTGSIQRITLTCDIVATVKKKECVTVPSLEQSVMLSSIFWWRWGGGALKLDGGQSFRARGLS
jgi:hypothetical protein